MDTQVKIGGTVIIKTFPRGSIFKNESEKKRTLDEIKEWKKRMEFKERHDNFWEKVSLDKLERIERIINE